MNENRATLEVIAPTVEEAVAKGLNDLGLPAEAVEVEVLDEGSRGLFGLGARQARIRLAIKASGSPAARPAPTVTPEAPARAPTAERPTPAEKPARAPKPQTARKPAASTRPARPAKASIPAPAEEEEELEEDQVWHDEEPEGEGAPIQSGVAGLDSDDVLEIARATVEELLERMRVRASVTAKFGQPDERRGRPPIVVDINGKDLSILIGRQAETLNALQYIAGLIVSKELGHNLSLVVDVQGYRQRREQQIRQLARRMADQAVKSGRRQTLEPMPAAERRIVHIELRDNPYVTTESIGEDPRRKVTINPK
jgi:spoIIIJ-associated protein